MTRTLDVGRTSGRGKSSHDTRCIPPSPGTCGVAPAGVASHKIPPPPHPHCRLSFFLAMPCSYIAGRNEDCEGRVPLFWGLQGQTTTLLLNWAILGRHGFQDNMRADRRELVIFTPLESARWRVSSVVALLARIPRVDLGAHA